MSREIDAKVAEHVMGWKVLESWFSPSQYIDDAWEVVDKMDDKYKIFEISKTPRGWCAVFSKIIEEDEKGFFDLKEYGADADTAPMAICLASLKAVGVDIDG